MSLIRIAFQAVPAFLAALLFQAAAVAAPVPAIAWQPHDYVLKSGQSVAASIGTLEVPAVRASNRPTRMTISFVKLHTTAKNPGRPIIYLAGGPGSSGIEAARGDRWPLFDALRSRGDVILLDQRGVGLSSPPPPCTTQWTYPADKASNETDFNASLETAAARCARQWRDAGVDLNAFNVRENAADVAALGMALGGRVRLVGVSYGSFLAFAVMRDYPAMVEDAVLVGVEGPDHTAKLPLQADAVLKGLSLRAYGDPGRIHTALERILKRLEQEPVWVDLPGSNNAARLLVGKYDVQMVTAFFAATSANAKRLPPMIDAMERGDFAGMAQSVLFLRRFLASLPAMPLAMDATSPVSPQRQREITRQQSLSILGNAVNAPSADFRSALGLKSLPSRWRNPLRLAAPVLLVSGELDSRTPPQNAIDVRRGFPNSVHLVIKGGGHDNDLFLYHSDIIGRIGQFLDGERLRDEVLAESRKP